MKKQLITLGLATALLAPAAAWTQNSGTATDTTYAEPMEQKDNDFPWGLLGLLGLAGLIPRKKHETVHVDNTRTPPR